jgi:TP901 family phage tail tape measure protein
MADSLEAGSLAVRLELESDDFDNKLDDSRDKMEDFGDTADNKLSVAIKVDDGEVDKIDEAKSKLEDLQSSGDQPLELKADTSEATSSLEGVQESLGSIQGMMEAVGEIALFAAAIESADQLIGKINEAVDAFGELQNASAGAGLKAGGTAAATQQVMDVARQLAPQVGKSPEDIAAVMSTIMGSGQSLGSISAKSLMPYMNLATLPNVGMQDAARLLTLTKNNFGIGESQSSDMYAKALESSNLSAGALSSAMPKMLLASKQANIPLDQMLSMMTAENQSKGADATQTAMALFTGANKLTAPLDPETMVKGKMTGGSGIAKELQDSGISLDTINNKSDSFLQKLVNLDKAGADFGKIFGARQGDLLKDIADNAQGIQNFSNVLDNSQGSAQNYANTMRDTLPEAEKRFGESMNELQTTVGEQFAPLKMKLLEDGKGLIDAITQGMQTGDFSGVATALSTLWQDVLNYFQNLDYSGAGQAILKDLEGAWNYATSMFMSSNYELTSPFTAIGNIIGPTLAHVFDTLRDSGIKAFNDLGRGVTTLANAIGSGLVGVLNKAIDLIANLIDAAERLSGIDLGLGGDTGSKPSSSGSGSSSGGASIDVGSGQTSAANKEAIRIGLDPNGRYTDIKTGFTTTGADFASRGTDPSVLVRAGTGSSSSGGSGSSSSSGTYAGAQATLLNPGNLVNNFASSSKNSVDIGGTGATGWQQLENLKSYFSYDSKTPTDYSALRQDDIKASQNLEQAVWNFAVGTEGNAPAITAMNQAAKDSIDAIPVNDRTLTQAQIANAIQNNQNLQATIKDSFGELVNAGTNPEKTKQGDTPDAAYVRGLESKFTPMTWTDIPLSKSADEAAAEVDVLKDGIFETSAGFDNFNQHLQSLGSSVESAASGMTASAQKYDASLNALTGQNGEYGCVMSEFGTWQEDNADYLFNQGYIGPSGANYDAFVAQEAARGAVHPGVDVLGENYGANQNKPATVQLGIDYSEADNGLTTIGTKASTKQVMPLSLDTGQATADLEAVSTSAKTEKQMPIVLEGVSQAQAIIDRLTAPEEKDIYIVTHYGSVGGGGGSNSGVSHGAGGQYGADVSSTDIWAEGSGGQGGVYGSPGGYGGNPTSFDMWNGPSFAAGDVFVPTPTLAMVGDQPGGEWIGSIAQAQARFGGQGGQGITVSAPLNIYAPVYGVDDLGAILAAHADGIMKAVEQNATLAQWR